APGRVALPIPLIPRDAELGSALLKLHGITAGGGRSVDQLAGETERAVVVDPDLGNHEDGVALSDPMMTDPDSPAGLPRRVVHRFTPFDVRRPPSPEKRINPASARPRSGARPLPEMPRVRRCAGRRSRRSIESEAPRPMDKRKSPPLKGLPRR